jgi:nucleotide-binding universal stress UspA family protein
MFEMVDSVGDFAYNVDRRSQMAKSKLLIPLDGSEFSLQIIGEVTKFFPPAQYDLVLLRVGEPQKGMTGHPTRPASADVPVPMYESAADLEQNQHPIFASQEYDSAISELKDELQKVSQRLEAEGYMVHVEVNFGDPAREIIKFVTDEQIALVAMSTHGRSGLSRVVFGSVAEQVLRHVNVPVLMMRPAGSPAGGDDVDSTANLT